MRLWERHDGYMFNVNIVRDCFYLFLFYFSKTFSNLILILTSQICQLDKISVKLAYFPKKSEHGNPLELCQ